METNEKKDVRIVVVVKEDKRRRFKSSRTQQLEDEGMTRSDAQSIVEEEQYKRGLK